LRVEPRESFPRLRRALDDLMLNTACPFYGWQSWGKKGTLLVMATHRPSFGDELVTSFPACVERKSFRLNVRVADDTGVIPRWSPIENIGRDPGRRPDDSQTQQGKRRIYPRCLPWQQRGDNRRKGSRLGLTDWHAPIVIRNDAPTFHHLLQHTASAVKPHLYRSQLQSQKVRYLRCSEGMCLVQHNHSAIVIGQEVQAPLHACARFLPLSDFQYRRSHRNCGPNLTRALSAVHRNVRSSLTQPIQTDMRADAVKPAANSLLVAKRVAVAICP
jgi:hypothetical protein